MKIVYGVCGEGFGHSSHAILVAKYLEKKGHTVLIATYGRAYNLLKKNFKVIETNWPELVYKEGRMSKKESIKIMGKKIIKNKFIKILRKIIKFKPDLFISDLEIYSSFISYLLKKPLITISNQNRFAHCKISKPAKKEKGYLFMKTISYFHAPKSNYKIILSLKKYKTKRKNSYFAPPIIRKEIQKLKPKQGKKILVYLSRPKKQILNTLKKTNQKFVVFGYNKNIKQKNLEFKTKDKFLKEFEKCKAIISTSGFTSIGEALYLNKPYLALPLKGQFEQAFNAILIEKKKFGMYIKELKKQDLEEFIKNIPEYRKNIKKYNIDTEKIYKILNKILRKIEIEKKERKQNKLIKNQSQIIPMPWAHSTIELWTKYID